MTKLANHLDYLNYQIAKGGPLKNEYDELTTCFNSASEHIQFGNITHDQAMEYWRMMGDAFCSMLTNQGFVCLKPHGYAGDFEVIDRIYTGWLSPRDDLRNWDHYYHAQPAVQAVCNRLAFFTELLDTTVSSVSQMSVLNIGSGPARDVGACLARHENLSMACLDQDAKAINYAKTLNNCQCDERLTFVQTNVFRYRPDKQHDIVWSAGLFDYLDDKQFVHLLRRLYETVKPGGLLVVGNFGTNNPSRNYMEFGQWFLNHRTTDELINLGRQCGVKTSKINVEAEPAGVNLFLHIEKG